MKGVVGVVDIDCLRAEHAIGGKKYPLFVGFMAANELGKIAEAPQFELKTEHHLIAANVLSTPVLQWQRPLDPARVDEISRIFSTSSEIMPNAVLLAAHDDSQIKIMHASGDLWTVSIATSKGRPVWILDGQHRIAGLTAAKSKERVPFVLLASHDHSGQYSESTFAKIFAQVTTTAEGLHSLHQEWLTFAFDLGKYDTGSPTRAVQNGHESQAMRATVHLCHERFLDVGKTAKNPFFDRVALNPKSEKRKAKAPQIGPTSGGFEFDASEWQALIRSSYYGNKSLPAGALSPKALAHEIGRAYEGLVECHGASARKSSVLLNSSGAAGHRPLQEALMHGVLRFLAVHGVPKNWKAELESRAFGASDWSSSAWSKAARGGTEGNLNKKLAYSIFTALFEGTLSSLFLPTATMPSDLDLYDYFKGDVGFGFELRGRRDSAAGTRLKFSGAKDPVTIIDDSKKSSKFALGSHRAVSLGAVTPNVLFVEAADVTRPFDKDWKWAKLRTKRGLDLSALMLHSSSVNIHFHLTFYGGEEVERTLKVETT